MAEKKNSIVAKAEARAEQMVKANEKSKTAAKKGVKKPNAVVRYFKDLRGEFKKVVWPSRQKVVNNTTVVVAAMVLCGIVIWGVDSGLGALLKLAIGG